uniref:Tubulin domain-containing protein n=1 Tax=Elaeophora elaphi TaxID=1147741 RepID=A0A0R3S589_9BILA
MAGGIVEIILSDVTKACFGIGCENAALAASYSRSWPRIFQFCDVVSKEHDIASPGTYYSLSDLQLMYRMEHIVVLRICSGAYFKKINDKKHFLRAVVVDLDSESLHTMLQSTQSVLFQSDNVVFGTDNATNCWAVGFYSERSKDIDQLLKTIRKEADLCTNLQRIAWCALALRGPDYDV